jgi:hypothetical protein
MHLQKKLDDFADYYNHYRVHISLRGAVPTEFGIKKISRPANLENFWWQSLCRGLVQLPIPT